MVSRSDIIWLGISSAVIGCLVGGMMLGIGMDLIVNGQPLGWLIMLPGPPRELRPMFDQSVVPFLQDRKSVV